MVGVDRSKLFMAAFTESLKQSSIVKKILQVAQMFGMMFLLVLPGVIFKRKGKSVVTQLTNSVIQIRYGPTSSNSYRY
jgi:hypothetical protein